MTFFKYVPTIILAVLMTMPLPLSQTLPGAVTNSETSPVVARIGVVSGYVEAGSITVRISGSPTLVEASYLFPAYEPLLGDIVYVTKQDSQWLVLGTMSGPINSAIRNPSFEEGTVSTTPDFWTATAVSTVAGTPTFRKETAGAIQGKHVGTFRNASAGVAGTSSINAFSAPVVAAEGSDWTLGFFMTYAEPDVNASLTPQGGNIQISGYIQFLDAASALISETLMIYYPFTSSFQDPIYARSVAPGTFQQSVSAPAGTEFVRVKLFVSFVMHVNSASELGVDVVYLREVT